MQTANLQRNLSVRMLGMITIGGSIGTGIFLASGNALYIAGPGGVMVAYLVTSILVYFLMACLCEMAAFMPSSGSFYVYAAKFVDPALGYALAWNYWYSWAIGIAAEISAAALIMRFWFPDIPSFVWCSVFITTIVGFNVFSTMIFGEVEYWLSLIKIVIIIIFISFGTMLVSGMTGFHPAGIKYWTMGDAPFHGGWFTLFSAFIIAGYSFQGTELIAVAAGETRQPESSVPRAMKQVFWRLFIFFILTIFIMTLLVPYTASELMNDNITTSPLIYVLREYGSAFAASFINVFILVAILSAGNTGMYASSRMLWYLAKKGHMPAIFSRVSKRGIPVYAIVATMLVSSTTFLSSIYGNGAVYFWLINAASVSGFIAWFGIAISHYRFRQAYVNQGRELSKLPYLAKGYPYNALSVLGLSFVIIVGQNMLALASLQMDWKGMLLSCSGVIIFITLWLGYKWIHKTKIVKLSECDFDMT